LRSAVLWRRMGGIKTLESLAIARTERQRVTDRVRLRAVSQLQSVAWGAVDRRRVPAIRAQLEEQEQMAVHSNSASKVQAALRGAQQRRALVQQQESAGVVQRQVRRHFAAHRVAIIRKQITPYVQTDASSACEEVAADTSALCSAIAELSLVTTRLRLKLGSEDREDHEITAETIKLSRDLRAGAPMKLADEQQELINRVERGTQLMRCTFALVSDLNGGSAYSIPLPSLPSMPEMKIPDIEMPEMKMPEVQMPEIKIPEIKMPW